MVSIAKGTKKYFLTYSVQQRAVVQIQPIVVEPALGFSANVSFGDRMVSKIGFCSRFAVFVCVVLAADTVKRRYGVSFKLSFFRGGRRKLNNLSFTPDCPKLSLGR